MTLGCYLLVPPFQVYQEEVESLCLNLMPNKNLDLSPRWVKIRVQRSVQKLARSSENRVETHRSNEILFCFCRTNVFFFNQFPAWFFKNADAPEGNFHQLLRQIDHGAAAPPHNIVPFKNRFSFVLRSCHHRVK